MMKFFRNISNLNDTDYNCVENIKEAEYNTSEKLVKAFKAGLGNNSIIEEIETQQNSGELAEPYSEELIPDNIREYLLKLKNYGDRILVEKAPDFEEISLMSRQVLNLHLLQ